MVWTNQGRRHGSGGAEVLNWATPIAYEILKSITSTMARWCRVNLVRNEGMKEWRKLGMKVEEAVIEAVMQLWHSELRYTVECTFKYMYIYLCRMYRTCRYNVYNSTTGYRYCKMIKSIFINFLLVMYWTIKHQTWHTSNNLKQWCFYWVQCIEP